MGLLSYLATARECMGNRFVSRHQLQQKQIRKFRRLVAYAQAHSPYYQRIIREYGISPKDCFPSDFPTLTKQEFIENFDEIVTDRTITSERVAQFIDQSTDCGELLDGKYLVVHTSGTSGRVAYYIYTGAEWDRGHLHSLRVNGLGIRRKAAHVAAMNGHFHGAVMSRRAQQGINRWFYDIQRFDINEPMPAIIDSLNEFQPEYLSGYGGGLKILSHYQQTGKLQIQPKRLMYGGEPLSSDERRQIGQIFNAEVISVYATSEHLMMGATVPGTDKMRLFEDYLHFEFASDHLLVTNLFNYSMPLIRYRMDDILTPAGVATKPHPFTLVNDLVGRNEQLLKFVNRDGEIDFIHPIVIAEFFVPNLQAFQLVLQSDEQFAFRAQLASTLTAAERAATKRRIEEKLDTMLAQKEMQNVEFQVQLVDEVNVDPATRKFRLIIDERRSTDMPLSEVRRVNQQV